MHVEVTHGSGRVVLRLSPDGDEATAGRVRLARDTATFAVDVPPGGIHPDLLVVTALLCARPWVRRSTPVTCSVPASAALAQAVRTGPGLRLAVVGDGPPRRVPEDGRPGLCLSGGTDSVAALAVMPESTRSYHLERRAPTGDRRATMMDGRAALESCEVVRRQGWEVTVVPSDLEYLRDPIGFPHDLATAAPLLLHADAHRLDAVAWGAPLEATYRLQRGLHRDYADSPFVAEWGPVLAAVGLPVCVPTAGVSEVVTSAIVHRHPLGRAAQSCVRGPRLGRPCGRCPKCARKTLLRAVVTGRWPADTALERQWRDTETREHLLASPMKVEPVLAHAAHRHLADGGRSELMRLVAAKAGPDPRAWLVRSYTPALDLLPPRYREEVASRLGEHAAPMSPEEEEAVRGYDVTGADPARDAAQEELERWFADRPPRDVLVRAARRGRREVRALRGRFGGVRPTSSS